ncbi:MAG: FeS cluster assembly protein SufD [Alphaproteobacteria bacterium]|nr:MAG: FeS cluster assembly protein SufD [Alphaproteobacteria bacterium]
MLEAQAYFDRVSGRLPGDAATRAKALAAAEKLGLPTRRQEAWHYTDLARLLGMAADDRIDAIDFSAMAPLMAVFENGTLVDAPAADGLTVQPFEAAVIGDDAMLNYNAALAQDGLNVEIDGQLAQPLLITTSGSNAMHLHHKIKLADGAKVVLVDNHMSAAYTNARFDIALGEGAELTLIRSQQAGHQVNVSDVSLARAARFKSVALVSGGALARHEARIGLMAEGAHADLHSAVLGHNKNHADFTYEIDHQAANTSSHTTAYNVLDDASRGVFQGKVIVRQDAQHVDAQMQTRAMMLSDGAEMDAKPELEIYADDVVCAHGSAIGELDRDALFFLRARGLDEASARHLLVAGFFEQVLAHIDDAALADVFRALLAQKITAQFADAEAA